jgi:hypothetical protein
MKSESQNPLPVFVQMYLKPVVRENRNTGSKANTKAPKRNFSFSACVLTLYGTAIIFDNSSSKKKRQNRQNSCKNIYLNQL